jgi:hypothetical protein
MSNEVENNEQSADIRLRAWEVLSSAWMIPVLLFAAWAPVIAVSVLASLLPRHTDTFAGFVLAWTRVLIPCTVLAVLSCVIQIVKFLVRAAKRAGTK